MRKLFLHHIPTCTHLLDLVSLPIIEKQIILIQQICNRDREQLGYFQHRFNGVIIPANFFVAGIGASIKSGEIRDIPLKQTTSEAMPSQLIWDIVDF